MWCGTKARPTQRSARARRNIVHGSWLSLTSSEISKSKLRSTCQWQRNVSLPVHTSKTIPSYAHRLRSQAPTATCVPGSTPISYSVRWIGLMVAMQAGPVWQRWLQDGQGYLVLPCDDISVHCWSALDGIRRKKEVDLRRDDRSGGEQGFNASTFDRLHCSRGYQRRSSPDLLGRRIRVVVGRICCVRQ